MKVNKFGRAAILTPTQINLLFNEGFTKPRDRALFGVCLYAAARINEACTLNRGDAIGLKGVRDVLVIRRYNTKGKQETREIQFSSRTSKCNILRLYFLPPYAIAGDRINILPIGFD